MLENRVLLEAIWISSVIERDQIVDSDAPIKNLPPYEHVERGSQFQLPIIGEKFLHVVVGIYLCDHQLPNSKRINNGFLHVVKIRQRHRFELYRAQQICIGGLQKLVK